MVKPPLSPPRHDTPPPNHPRSVRQSRRMRVGKAWTPRRRRKSSPHRGRDGDDWGDPTATKERTRLPYTAKPAPATKARIGVGTVFPVQRPNVTAAAEARPWRRTLDVPAVLGLVLHWLNSSVQDGSLELIFAVLPSVCARYLRFGLRILLETLKIMPHARIAWLDAEQFTDLETRIRA
ncbi:hypothetical protein RUND412_011020 [Rhizina undulata]